MAIESSAGLTRPSYKAAATDLAVCCGLFLAALLPMSRNFGACLVDASLWDFAAGLLDHVLERHPDHHLAINAFGIQWPLALSRYHGPWAVYPLMALIPYFGRKAILAYNILFCCLTIAGTYALSIQLYGSRLAAFLGALLLSTSPAFVTLGGLTGLGAGIATAAACLFATAFLLRYADSPKPLFAVGAAACLGFALGSFAWAIAWVLGLVVCGFLSVPIIRRFAASRPGETIRLALYGAGVLAAFMAPLALYNLRTGGASLHFVGNHASLILNGGLPVNSYQSGFRWNLTRRLFQFAKLASGHYTDYSLGVPPAGSQSVLAIYALIGAAVITAALYFLYAGLPKRRLWPWIIGVVYLGLSPLSPSALSAHHLLPLLPLLCVAVGSLVLLGRRRPAVAGLAALVAIGALAELAGMKSAAAQAAGDNAPYASTRAVRELSAFLRARKSSPAVSAVPYLSYELLHESAGRLLVPDFPGDTWAHPGRREAFAGQVVPRQGGLVVFGGLLSGYIRAPLSAALAAKGLGLLPVASLPSNSPTGGFEVDRVIAVNPH